MLGSHRAQAAPSAHTSPMRKRQNWSHMFKEMLNLPSLLRQASEITSRMHVVTEQLRGKRVMGSAGGGMVEVEANGLGEILRVKIDPVLQDREMVEDLIPAAVNQAIQRARELHMEEMKSSASDLDIPGLSDAIGKITGGS